GDDRAVELRRSVEVMVVGGQPRQGQGFGLLISQHAERAACLHPQSADAAHHLKHTVELLTLWSVAPCRAHTEARRALLARLPGRIQRLVYAQKRLARNAGLITSRLRAVG